MSEDLLFNGIQKEDLITQLEGWLPWSISVLSLVVSDGAIKLIHDHRFRYIAAFSRFHEWICYLDDESLLPELINQIETFPEECRIIVFSQKKLFIDDLLKQSFKKVKCQIEDFMVLQNSIISNGAGYSVASEKDIRELALLQSEYIQEEVDWKYHRRTFEELMDTYQEKIITSKLFVRGCPIVSKVEVIDIYHDYAKVSGVYTKPDMRHKGLAKLCLVDAIGWAAEHNIKLCLNVRCDNLHAKQLYEKLGFAGMGKVLYYRLEEGSNGQ